MCQPYQVLLAVTIPLLVIALAGNIAALLGPSWVEENALNYTTRGLLQYCVERYYPPDERCKVHNDMFDFSHDIGMFLHIIYSTMCACACARARACARVRACARACIHIICNLQHAILERDYAALMMIVSCVFLAFSLLSAGLMICCRNERRCWFCGAICTTTLTFIGGNIHCSYLYIYISVKQYSHVYHTHTLVTKVKHYLG